MVKYYILGASYEGPWDTNSDDIVCVGSKEDIDFYIEEKYPEHENTDDLYSEGNVEITSEIRLYLLEHHIGYAVMAFSPGGSNELEWYEQEDDARKRLNELEDQYSTYTDDEYVCSMRLYHVKNDDFEVLRELTMPYME